MKIDVDNDKREIYINGVKSTVTWGLLDHHRLKTEYGISIHAEVLTDIKWHIIHEFQLGAGYKMLLSWVLAAKLKLKWDDD